MKRTGIDHPKTKRLVKLLGVTHFAAVGILECVWQFTARHAIRGDIGRWSDQEIADAIGWPAEDAGRLIAALVDAVWIERHSQNRLIVHDWKDHCDESTKKTIKNHGWEFVQAEPRVASRESFSTVPETFRNDRESFSTVPDSQSLSQAVAIAEPDGIDSETRERDAIRRYTAPKILLISDPVPPSESLTAFQQSVLWRIVDRRYRDIQPTWVTMNVSSGEEAEKRVGAQIVDRLRDGALSIVCNWPSHRKSAAA